MSPEKILHDIQQQAEATLNTTVIASREIFERVDYVCRCTKNRAGVRLLMACLLGKLMRPEVDPRKPYTEIGGADCFSGRTYDERYLAKFINEHRLPVNSTTAFLTPTLRNIAHPLTTDRELVGRPRDLYKKTLELLEDVAEHRISAYELFVETLRILMQMRDESLDRIASRLSALARPEGSLPLSSHATLNLISKHLACKNASRLPVLVVAAAYQVAGARLSERMLPLHPHNAADRQTGSRGDVEITLIDEAAVVTVYEMKMKRVTHDDIHAAVDKIANTPNRINNYLFITTDTVDPGVAEYAATFYAKTGGTEIAILDCIGFLRYFLYLFPRARADFLNTYQSLVLTEPDSAVSQSLKETFLELRHAAEAA